jgi:dynein assembly factor 5
MLKLVLDLVTKMKERYSPFVEDTLQIIGRTVLDTYQEIKKISCQIVETMCVVVPSAVALHGGTPTKHVLACVNHRHSSVRIVALKALAKTLIVDASAIEDCLEQIKDLNRDKSPAVREQLYSFAAQLQVDLMDRHVYAHRILPLLYAGMKDEMPKLVALCTQYVDQAGERYESDNKDRIKDEMDYSDGHDRVGRPRVGSRHIARDNTQKIVNKQIELLGDWNVEARAKAAQVLTVFIDFAESNITGYANVMLPAIYKILAGDEEVVVQEAKSLMSKLGEFVHPDTTLSLLLPALKTGGGGLSTFRLGCLRALGSVLQGSPAELMVPLLPDLLNELSDRDLVTNENCLVLLELARCLLFVGDKLTKERPLLFKYFFLAIHLKSVPGTDKVIGYTEMQAVVNQVFDKLASLLCTQVATLYLEFLPEALERLQQTSLQWTQYSIEPRVLETMLLNNVQGFYTHFESFIPIFAVNASSEKDFELRDSILRLALALFQRSEASQVLALSPPAFSEFFKSVGLSCCIWKGGRKAMQLRSLAVQTVHRMLDLYQAHAGLPELLGSIMDTDLLPVVLTNLDDDEMVTRTHCLFTLNILLDLKLFKGISCSSSRFVQESVSRIIETYG